MRINFFHTAATSTRLQDEGKLSVPLDFYRNCRSLLSLPFPQPQISVFWLKGQLTALNKYFFFLILLFIRVCLKGRLVMTCSILASFCILQSKLQITFNIEIKIGKSRKILKLYMYPYPHIMPEKEDEQ